MKREEDMDSLVKELISVKPFQLSEGRAHRAFRNFTLKESLPKPEKLKASLLRAKEKWAIARQVEELMQRKDLER